MRRVFMGMQEDGDLEKATPEKLRLEEKQRKAQKLRKEKGEDWRPLWFRQVCLRTRCHNVML